MVTGISLGGVMLAITQPFQFADDFGVVQIVLGWAFLAGLLALVAIALGHASRLGER